MYKDKNNFSSALLLEQYCQTFGFQKTHLFVSLFSRTKKLLRHGGSAMKLMHEKPMKGAKELWILMAVFVRVVEEG